MKFFYKESFNAILFTFAIDVWRLSVSEVCRAALYNSQLRNFVTAIIATLYLIEMGNIFVDKCRGLFAIFYSSEW